MAGLKGRYPMADLQTVRTAASDAIDGRWGPGAPDATASAVATPAVSAEHAINQRIFETSLDLILVVDRRGTFIRVSPSSQAILGYHPDEMVGRSATGFLYHEDLEGTRNEMRQARSGKVTRHFECRYVHKHGRVITLTWTGVWSEPEQQHFFIGRDITELKETERRLRQSERRFEDMIEVSADWIWETDRQHRFIVFRGGTTSVVPLAPQALLGRTRWDAAEVDPAQDERWACHKADLDAGRPFRHFRYALSIAGGKHLFLSSSGKPLFDEGGAFIGYLGTSTDETVAMIAPGFRRRRIRSGRAGVLKRLNAGSCGPMARCAIFIASTRWSPARRAAVARWQARSMTSPSGGEPKSNCGRPRRWRRSATSRAGSRTTSTICSG
jgi:PAS domain S-box-containing protein